MGIQAKIRRHQALTPEDLKNSRNTARKLVRRIKDSRIHVCNGVCDVQPPCLKLILLPRATDFSKKFHCRTAPNSPVAKETSDDPSLYDTL